MPFDTPFVKRSRVFGLGVNEFGLINSVLVADPTNLFGERIGEPVFLPTNVVEGECCVGVYPRGRILAVDLGAAR